MLIEMAQPLAAASAAHGLCRICRHVHQLHATNSPVSRSSMALDNVRFDALRTSSGTPERKLLRAVHAPNQI